MIEIDQQMKKQNIFIILLLLEEIYQLIISCHALENLRLAVKF